MNILLVTKSSSSSIIHRLLFQICNSLIDNKAYRLVLLLRADELIILVSSLVVFTALHRMQTRSSNENFVRLSVRPSVRPSVKSAICGKMEERSVQIFISYERSVNLVF